MTRDHQKRRTFANIYVKRPIKEICKRTEDEMQEFFVLEAHLVD